MIVMGGAAVLAASIAWRRLQSPAPPEHSPATGALSVVVLTVNLAA